MRGQNIVPPLVHKESAVFGALRSIVGHSLIVPSGLGFVSLVVFSRVLVVASNETQGVLVH